MKTVELICKKLHMPWPNVRIPANSRISLGPPELAEALCVRGFFEKIPPEIIAQESKPPDVAPKKEKKSK